MCIKALITSWVEADFFIKDTFQLHHCHPHFSFFLSFLSGGGGFHSINAFTFFRGLLLSALLTCTTFKKFLGVGDKVTFRNSRYYRLNFSSKLNIVDSYGQNSTVVVIRIFILTENKDSFFY